MPVTLCLQVIREVLDEFDIDTDVWNTTKNERLLHVRINGLMYTHWRFGAVGSDVGRINEVTLRRARLVLGWVTVSGFNSHCGKFISV